MLLPLKNLFEQWSGEPLLHSQELTGAGSHRSYYRLCSKNKVVVGCYGENTAENQAFIALTKHFGEKNLNTPQVYAAADAGKYYLQQDLGDVSLFDFIENGRNTGLFSDLEKTALKQTLSALAQFQFEGAEGLDFSQCYPVPAFDLQSVLWDLNYFKYCFLKPHLENFNEQLLQRDFDNLAQWICREKNVCFLYRDFQSRNVMYANDHPYFIDFQGGRKGMPHYDVASFLYQAKANFSDDLRSELLEHYLQAAKKYPALEAENFKQKIYVFALLRSLQVLGAYGFRGHFERKVHFLKSIPFAIKNLSFLLPAIANTSLHIPYLTSVLKQLVVSETAPISENAEQLCVQVFSFSYRRGLPEDVSGNGGGFVFDCRNIENPGRQEEFRFLTGLDAPVSQFLDKNDQMQLFLQHICALTDTAVERYSAKGFKNLMISFGCTGGQHRSVYAAQHIADRLRQKYPDILVRLKHREQRIEN